MSKIPVRRLLTAIVDLYRVESALGGQAAPLLSLVLQAIAATPYPREAMRLDQAASRVGLPVSRLLAGMEPEGPLATLITLLRAAEPHLDWLQDEAVINGAPAEERLRDGYGTVEIVGPQRMFRSPATTIGFLLLAPGLGLPAREQPAEEACHVVSGEAEWARDGADWRAVTPGSVVHVPSMTRYAVRTLTRPLLVLYCRRGEPGKAKVRAGKPGKGAGSTKSRQRARSAS